MTVRGNPKVKKVSEWRFLRVQSLRGRMCQGGRAEGTCRGEQVFALVPADCYTNNRVEFFKFVEHF